MRIHRFTASIRAGVISSVAGLILLATPALAGMGGGYGGGNGPGGSGNAARSPNAYTVQTLTSDGFITADHNDTNLVNGWGIAAGATGPWWVANNGSGNASLIISDGTPQGLVVGLEDGATSKPTGIVFNGTASFVVTNGNDSGVALFIFASEEGKIFAWSPGVPAPPPSTQAFQVADSSPSGAIYKGLAIASTGGGDRLYATDFHNGKVDVFDGSFQPVTPAGDFVDPKIPGGFAPFGIRNINGRIFVTFAKQDADKEDDVPGQGLGFVSVFDTDGNFIARIGTHGRLNAPWGLALAPAGFGRFGGDLLVGNFGDGKINAFHISDDMKKAEPRGALRGTSKKPITISGLWGIAFGNGSSAGATTSLYFAAGPADEAHGLFGRIDPQ